MSKSLDDTPARRPANQEVADARKARFAAIAEAYEGVDLCDYQAEFAAWDGTLADGLDDV